MLRGRDHGLSGGVLADNMPKWEICLNLHLTFGVGSHIISRHGKESICALGHLPTSYDYTLHLAIYHMHTHYVFLSYSNLFNVPSSIGI